MAPCPSVEIAAAVSKHDRFERRIVGEHGDDKRVAPSVGRSGGDPRAFPRQRLRFVARAVIDGQAMAGREKVARDRAAHIAEPNETDIHACLPGLRAQHAPPVRARTGLSSRRGSDPSIRRRVEVHRLFETPEQPPASLVKAETRPGHQIPDGSPQEPCSMGRGDARAARPDRASRSARRGRSRTNGAGLRFRGGTRPPDRCGGPRPGCRWSTA